MGLHVYSRLLFGSGTGAGIFLNMVPTCGRLQPNALLARSTGVWVLINLACFAPMYADYLLMVERGHVARLRMVRVSIVFAVMASRVTKCNVMARSVITLFYGIRKLDYAM